MKKIDIIKSEKAVSEVLGMVMILSIMMLVIGSILLVGVPMIESAKSRASMDVSMNSFLSMQNDIEEVVRGPIWIPNENSNVIYGPSRETQFELMGGMLTILPNNDSVSVQNSMIKIPSSNITYVAGEERISFENGAVIRKYEDGVAMMVSNPLISIYRIDNNNISVSIHAISLNGTLSSSSGEGKTWVETRLLNYTPINESSNPNQTINITSEYPEAWEAFFDTTLKNMGLERQMDISNQTGYYISNISRTMPLQVIINGNNNPSNINDINLSVVESRLDINIR